MCLCVWRVWGWGGGQLPWRPPQPCPLSLGPESVSPPTRRFNYNTSSPAPTPNLLVINLRVEFLCQGPAPGQSRGGTP